MLLPSRMGNNFRWLVASSWISNIGDGLALSAGPLRVAAHKVDPIFVARVGSVYLWACSAGSWSARRSVG